MMEVQSEEDSIFNRQHLSYHDYSFHKNDGQSYLLIDKDYVPVNTFIGCDPATDIDNNELEYKIHEALRKKFRPEFINRIDESIVFHPLGVNELNQIVKLQIKRLSERIYNSKKLELRVSESAIKWISLCGFDPIYGARPIKRAIQRELETPIAKSLLKGKYLKGQTINIDLGSTKKLILS